MAQQQKRGAHYKPGVLGAVALVRRFRKLFPLLAFVSFSAFASDILVNPGFEADVSSTPIGWTVYGPNVYSETSASVAQGGTNYLKVYQQFIGSLNYSGVYQDNISGSRRDLCGGWLGETLSSDTLAGQNVAWIEVTFRDAAGNILSLYRSSLITTNAIATGALPKSAWIDLPITNQYDPGKLTITNYTTSLVAPAGTSYVRYQITFQGDAANSGGSVYFDDLNLAQTAGQIQGNWNIVWSDEFNGYDFDQYKNMDI